MFFAEDPDAAAEALAYELVGRGGDALDRSLEGIGVYVDDKQVVVRNTANGPQAAMFISGVLGRVAFRDQVQRPDQAAVDSVFDQIAGDFIDDEYEKRRRDLGG